MNAIQFFTEYSEEISKSMPKPLFVPELKEEESREIIDFLVESLVLLPYKHGSKKIPFPGQLEHVIAPIFNLYDKRYDRGAIIVGEMGTGKTIMSNALAISLYLKEYAPKGKGFKAGMFISGDKHFFKMKGEIEEIAGDLVEVYRVKTNPRKKNPFEITIQEAAKMPRKPGKMLYFLLSKDIGKREPKKIPFVAEWKTKCPDCGKRLLKNDKKAYKKPVKLYACPSCESKLYSLKDKILPYSQILKNLAINKHDKFWDFFIFDEVHEFKNIDSQQSKLFRAIMDRSFRFVVMTGTATNGFASSLFGMLYHAFPKLFKKYDIGFKDLERFIDLFGSKRIDSKVKVRDGFRHGREQIVISELPEISDRIIAFLAPVTVWFDMKDLNVEMPPFKEFEEIVPMDEDILVRFKAFLNQSKNIMSFVNRYKDIESLNSDLTMPYEAYRNVSSVTKNISYLINNHTKRYEAGIDMSKLSERMQDIISGSSLRSSTAIFEPFEKDHFSAKEKKLVELIRQELSEDRKVLVYTEHGDSIDLYERLEYVLAEHGIVAESMPTSLKSENIAPWCLSEERPDVIIVPQRRVNTGLDLVRYNTVIFYELVNQLEIVEQAKVRPWRPVGQKKEVRVYYLQWEWKEKESLIQLATKMRSSKVVNGTVVENDTIAAIYDFNPEMTQAIKNITVKLENSEVNNLRSHSELERYYLERIEYYKSLEPQSDNKKFKGDNKPEGKSSTGEEKSSDTQEANVEAITEEVTQGKVQDVNVYIDIIPSFSELINISAESFNEEVEVACVEIVTDSEGQLMWAF